MESSIGLLCLTPKTLVHFIIFGDYYCFCIWSDLFLGVAVQRISKVHKKLYAMECVFSKVAGIQPAVFLRMQFISETILSNFPRFFSVLCFAICHSIAVTQPIFSEFLSVLNMVLVYFIGMNSHFIVNEL